MGYFETLVKKAQKTQEPLPAQARETKPPFASPKVEPTESITGGQGRSEGKSEGRERILIDSYGDVKIYKDPEESFLVYEIPVPHYKGGEKELINALLQVAIGVMPPDVASLSDEEKRRRYYNKVLEIIEKSPELNVPIHAKDFYANAVVREMAGYSLIDPLVADDNLEEIMIIGPGKPVYVFHRKYEMMKTNVVFYDDEDVRNLIERIGRTVGRRIDVQVPLLDARLPDGTRVNATIPPASIDGSTLTLRKFRKDPFSVIDLINFGTLDFATAALLWMATDGLGAYPANILIAGGTASGKCMVGSTPIALSNGRIVEIKDLVEEKFSGSKPLTDGAGWSFVQGDGTRIIAFDSSSLKLKPALVRAFWRHDAPPKLIRIKTRTGRSITVTPEHPFFVFKNASIVKTRADALHKGDRLAVPRELPTSQAGSLQQVDLLPLLYTKNIFVHGENSFVKRLVSRLKTALSCNSLAELAGRLGVNALTLRAWTVGNAIPANKFIDFTGLTQEAFSRERIPLTSKTGGRTTSFERYLTPELMRFLGLVLADGHLARKYVEFHNSDPVLLSDFIQLGERIFAVKGKIEHPKNRTSRARIYSSVAAAILNKAFGVPIGNKSAAIRLPDFALALPNNFISAFLSGLYDCDSSVNVENAAGQGQALVEYSTKSGILAQQLPFLLLRFGIVSHPLVSKSKHYRIVFYGRSNCAKFAESVSLRNQSKLSRLNRVISSGSRFSQVDLYPGLGKLLNFERGEKHFSQAELSRIAGLSRRAIGLYENNQRAPGRDSLQRLAVALSAEKLLQLSESQVFFDELAELEVVENHGQKFVYDLTVDEFHTFIAGSNGGIVAHNTTTLNVLSSFVPNNERIVTIEDTAELSLPLEHWIRLEVRPPSLEGTGEISMNDLVKNSIRMRPDRIIVGEIRGEEGYTMFAAMNTGHRGVMGTVHANSAQETLVRLSSPPINVPPVMVSSLNLIIMQNRIHDRRLGTLRRITEIAEVVSQQLDKPEIQVTYAWDPVKDKIRDTGVPSLFFELLKKYTGLDDAGIHAELAERENVLRQLAQSGVRSASEVCAVTQRYISKKKLSI